MSGLDALRAQIEALPTGVTFSREAVLEMLAKVGTNGLPRPSQEPQEGPPAPWPERLWITHPDCRMTVTQLAAALGKKKAFVYKAATDDDDPLPGRKLGGSWSFRVEDVRRWVERNEAP